MTFFNKEMVNKINKQREIIKKNVEEYQKSRRELEPDEVIKMIKLVQEHYSGQFNKPVEEREIFEHEGSVYTVFKTHEDPIERAGEIINLPSETKNGSIRVWCDYPLMTPNDANFAESITVFVDKEKFEFSTWKTMVLAKGRMKIEYKLKSEEGYAKSLTKFLAEQEIESLDEIEFEKYERKFTFSLDQVLEMMVLED